MTLENTITAILAFLLLIPGVALAEARVLTLTPPSRTCFEVGSSIVIDGEYDAGVLHDLAVFYST